MNPSLQAAIGAAPHVKGVLDALGGPIGLVGRIAGFSGDDLENGVPNWAWLLIGAGVGATAMWFAKEPIDNVLERSKG